MKIKILLLLMSWAPWITILMLISGIVTRVWANKKSRRRYFTWLGMLTCLTLITIQAGFRWDIRDILYTNEQKASVAVEERCNKLGANGIWLFMDGDTIKRRDYSGRHISIIRAISFHASGIRSFLNVTPSIRQGAEIYNPSTRYTRFRVYLARIDGLPYDFVVFAGLVNKKWVVFTTSNYEPEALYYGSDILASAAGYNRDVDLQKIDE